MPIIGCIVPLQRLLETRFCYFFDQLNAIRRAIVWGRLRIQTGVPPRDHLSFAQHDAIVRAIRERDSGECCLNNENTP